MDTQDFSKDKLDAMQKWSDDIFNNVVRYKELINSDEKDPFSELHKNLLGECINFAIDELHSTINTYSGGKNHGII